MDNRTVYRCEIDGVMMYEDYETPEKAMQGAKIYFSKDPSLKEAHIIKYMTIDCGVTILNKRHTIDSALNNE